MASSTRYRNIYVESPASFNARYITPSGFVCQLTLRGENELELLEKANATLSLLLEQGNSPLENSTNNHHASQDIKVCLFHHAEMRRREKDGRYWYSHQLEDGSWCWGRQQSKEEVMP
jgi:hypothetical protein